MHLLLKRLYGSTSEKFDPRQGVLFDAPRARTRRQPTHRRPLPAARPSDSQESRPARPRSDSRRDQA